MKNNITGKASVDINASVTSVWDALTKPEQIKNYFFGTDAHTTWEPGSPITFTGEWQGKKYEDKGKVLEVEKNKKVKYTYWSEMSGIEDKPENYVVITYALSEKDGKTHLDLIQENIPDEKMKAHSEENWNKVLQGLKEMVEKEHIHA